MAGCCQNPQSSPLASEPESNKESTQKVNKIRYFGIGILVFALWLAIYTYIIPFSQWVAYDLLSLVKESSTGAAVEFFVYDTAKILLLLVIMVYAIAWLRATLNAERVRDYLAGKGRALGYLAGSGFGAITPFCSCSSIPLFLGFTTARIPIGITMSFLITSPLINEVAVVLLWGLLGWKFTTVYVVVGMAAGIIGGIVMDMMRAERWLQPFLLDALQNDTTQEHNAASTGTPKMGLMERHNFAWGEMIGIVRRVWLWVIIGVGLGAVLHGYVPQEWFTENLGAGQWWSVLSIGAEF